MSDYSPKVNKQYGRDNLADQIIAALKNDGKDITKLTRADLSTFDEFHIGGLVETRNLVNKIPNFKKGYKVLDVGSGLGGPARTLADEFECEVVGLDLTVEFCNAATKLTELVGLSDKVNFKQGNALDMPFEDNSFDVVWTQFAGMNIDDKLRLYEQCFRVLRDGGYLAFHEVMAGEKEGLIFPVFWADNDDVNFLQPIDTVQTILTDIGFEQVEWLDLTQYSYEWFEKMIEQRKQQTEKPPLGFNVFVGEDTPLKAQNIINNLREKHITVAQAVYQAKKN